MGLLRQSEKAWELADEQRENLEHVLSDGLPVDQAFMPEIKQRAAEAKELHDQVTLLAGKIMLKHLHL